MLAVFFWIESCLHDQQHSDSQQEVSKREAKLGRRFKESPEKCSEGNALKENSGWEVKLVKLPTASLCRRRVYTDFPALRGGEKSFVEHEKQKPVWKTCSLWTISLQIICFGMGQNEGDTRETTETEGRDVFGGISQQKTHQKLWIQEQTPGNRRFTLFWAWNQGLGMAEWEILPSVYPKDRSHFCSIITGQQELGNIQGWIN